MAGIRGDQIQDGEIKLVDLNDEVIAKLLTAADAVADAAGTPAAGADVAATITIQGVTFTAAVAGEEGNNIEVEFVQRTYVSATTTATLTDDGLNRIVEVFLGTNGGGTPNATQANVVSAVAGLSATLTAVAASGGTGVTVDYPRALRGGRSGPSNTVYNATEATTASVKAQLNTLLANLRLVNIIQLSPPVVSSVVPGNKQVTVNWTAVPTATAYRVFYGTTNPVTEGNALGHTDFGLVLTGAITGLTNETQYYFAVEALHGTAPTDMSNTLGGYPIAAAAPVVTLTSGNTQIVVDWGAVVGETAGYRVFIKTSEPSRADTYITVGTGVLTHTFTLLTNGVPYHVKVEAMVGTDEGLLSADQIATPSASQLPSWTIFNDGTHITSAVI
jgi:hypothetical protein